MLYQKRYISSERSLELTSLIFTTMMCLASGQKSQTLVYSSITVYTSIIQGVSLGQKSHHQLTECKAYPHVSLCLLALIKLYLDKTSARKA